MELFKKFTFFDEEGSRLCVIPIDGNDVLCYEFFGTYEGNDYYVYIDAKTAKSFHTCDDAAFFANLDFNHIRIEYNAVLFVNEVKVAGRAVLAGPLLCYEFFGTYEGNDYYVYIDAKTGDEVQVFTVIGTAQGRRILPPVRSRSTPPHELGRELRGRLQLRTRHRRLLRN